MPTCRFCDIANGAARAAIAHETEHLLVFADHRPIRPGHMQIVPRDHYEVFEDLPPDLAAEIVHLGQRLARAQKRLFGVARIGFVFTGNDVAHCHAHVLPLHDAADVTSRRYFEDADLRIVGAPRVSWDEQVQAAAELKTAMQNG